MDVILPPEIITNKYNNYYEEISEFHSGPYALGEHQYPTNILHL